MSAAVVPASRPTSRLVVFTCFVVATLIWGSTWFVIRDQLGIVPPNWSIAYRFLIGSAAMFAYAAISRVRIDIGGSGQRFAILLGLAQFVGNFTFVYQAERYITSGLVAVVFALLILPNALIARAWLKTPLSGRFLAGSAVALVGVGLLIGQEAQADASSSDAKLWGVALTLLGVLSASIANVMQATPRAQALPMASMLAWAMLWGALMNGALALVTSGWPIWELRTSYWLGLLYLGVFASAISFSCYYVMLRELGPARAAYSSVLTPILAMLLSTLFEGYAWTGLAIAGGIVAMVGLLIALSGPRRAR